MNLTDLVADVFLCLLAAEMAHEAATTFIPGLKSACKGILRDSWTRIWPSQQLLC